MNLPAFANARLQNGLDNGRGDHPGGDVQGRVAVVVHGPIRLALFHHPSPNPTKCRPTVNGGIFDHFVDHGRSFRVSEAT